MSDLHPDAQSEAPACPKCGGAMWDNRASKRNPRAPDYKCRDKSCDGVIWPPRDAVPAAVGAAAAAGAATAEAPAKVTPAKGTPDDPACPVCGGRMWDDRASKRNPRAPDFKCRNKPKVMGGPGCPGVIWPPRPGEARAAAATAPPRPAAPRAAPPPSDAPPPTDADRPEWLDDDDELPF